jgi:hypothetical protein
MGRVIYAAPLQQNVSCSSRNNHIKGGQQPARYYYYCHSGCGFFFPSSSSSSLRRRKHNKTQKISRSFISYMSLSFQKSRSGHNCFPFDKVARNMSPQGTVRYKKHFFSLERKKKQEIKKENQKIARKQRK